MKSFRIPTFPALPISEPYLGTKITADWNEYQRLMVDSDEPAICARDLVKGAISRAIPNYSYTARTKLSNA